MQYIRQKGTNDVFAIINGGAYHVDEAYAKANNVFAQVQDVPYRIDTKYPLSGPIQNAVQSTLEKPKTAADTNLGGSDPANPPSNTGGAAPVEDTDLSKSGKYVQTDNGDVYDTTTNQKIDQTTFQNLHLNSALIPKVPQAPGGTSTTGSSVDFNNPKWYQTFGITDAMWGQLDPATQSFVKSTASLVQTQYDQGVVNASINADLLNKAMTAAASDPDIKAKYGDALTIAQQDLQKNLALINTSYASQDQITRATQAKEKKDLAETEAAAGRTYSGFRKQAEDLLATNQSGVITSAKSQLQQKLNTLGSSLESTYGTAGLSKFDPISAGGLDYTPYGGITGSEAASKKADIEAKGLSTFNNEKL